MSNLLYLYTLTFPYGKGEAFLEAEIEVLSRNHDQIILVPLSSGGDKRGLPGNVITKNIFEESEIFKVGIGLKLKLLSSTKIRFPFIKDCRYQMSLLADLASKAEVLHSYLITQEKGLHYTYWLDEWATILSLLKVRGTISSFVSRVHGFDLYEERARIGYKPWRSFQLKNVSKVFCVSESGKKYLHKKYPAFSSKISTAFLGTKDLGIGKLSDNNMPHLMSCSSVIPLKRVGQIIEILKDVNIRVSWTHIGGGVLLDDVQKEALKLPENIEYTFLGSQSHSDVMEFYLRNKVDCFINLSTTEGLPVSMMEALSFGVPILATNVGGVSEIVNEKTGKLINVSGENSEFDLKEARSKLISLFHEVSSNKNFRKDIRKFWKENFSANKNYRDFSENILTNTL